MVAIVAGKGLGLLNTSLDILGAAGALGQSVLGQGGSRAFVNAATGNLVLLMEDEQLSGRGLDLYALRTYNSLGPLNDGDGDGWRWGYEQTVRFQGQGSPAQPQAGATLIRTAGDGHETTYTWNTTRAAYIGTEGAGAHDELRYDSEPGEWVWTDGSTRVTERYSNSTSSSMTGRLNRRTDTSNNSIDLMYDAGGRLTLIRDVGGRQELQLKYGLFNGLTRLQRLETRALLEDASGRATATLGDALRQVEYGYDSSGRLTTVTTDLTPADGRIADGAVFVTTYTYDQTTPRIASVTQSDGTSVFFTYDSAGRVGTVKDHSGATSAQVIFTYDAATNSTAITDGNGQVWTYRYDATTRQLTEVLTPAVDGAALSTKFQYDASGNLLCITDARNNTVSYGYDSNGNRTLERDASGNTVTRTFSSVNQMLTETSYRTADPDGAGTQSPGDPFTTRYVHDANARLRFVVSAEGRVTESRYGTASVGYGLLTHRLQYIGQVYDLTGLDPAAPLTEAQLTAWVAGLQDKTQVQLTEYGYDLRGNLSQQTNYAAVSAAGTGVLDGQASVSEYLYDAHTRLRRRITVRGSARDQRTEMTSLAHDGMGRVLTSTDANGTQTSVYDDANRNFTVTSASGLIETRNYDSRGRLVSVGLTGDGTTRETRYVYNNADQLRMVEDAQGGRRYRFYDAAGRLAFAVDATGAVTRSEYNATGQIIRQTQYLNRADTSGWYDSATQTVTKQSLTVGGAGSDVPADAAHDRVTTFGYDAAGRLTTSSDATGTVTTTRYDGASRVVVTQTADRVTRYLYDKDNRKVGSVDALGYLTEYRYDAGGRLIETVRYSRRSPAAANLAAPVWIGVSNQNAVAGRPFEYRVPAYDADGDPLTFSVVGTPPGWLSFDAGTATLRGTPPAAVTNYNVTLRAEDGRGKTSDVTVLISVTNAAPGGGQGGAGPTWAPLPPLDVVTNTPVNYVVPAAAGQSLTYGVESGLPSGLSFNASTRAITGSSGAVGFYTIVLRVTNASGQSVDRTVSVQICASATTPDQPAGGDQLAAWRPADTSALHSYVYYDGQGRVVGAVDEQQFLSETFYDDALNTQRTLRYSTPVTVAPGDTLASLKSRAGASRQTSFVRYDGFGRVSEVTGLDSSTMTRNEYDEAGRIMRIVSAANTIEQRAHRTFYNAFGEVTATLGGEGDAWLGTNPTPQRISEAIRDYGMRHEYDTLGRAIRSVDANGNKTLFYYDRENRLTHTINVIGQSANNTLAGEVTETKYNSFGQKESVRQYAKRLADADMDQLLAGGGGGFADPLLLSKLLALADTNLDQVSSLEYDRSGRLVKEVDAENGVTVNIYNAHSELAAQVRSQQEGRSTTTQFDYDLNGRMVSRTDDAGGINQNTRTAYDAFGRVIQSIDGAGKATTTAYPDSGRTVVVTDPLNRIKRTEHDALGRVVRMTNALNQQTVYAYNEAARRVTVTTPENVQMTTARTRHDETLRVTDGRGNVTHYSYNKDGQQTTVTDALGRVIANTLYDQSGRKFEVTDARGAVTRFGYDQRNRVIDRRVDPNGLNLRTLFEFNALGQQIKVTEAANTVAAWVTTYAYDRKNQMTQAIVDPNGLKLTTRYTFDSVGNTVKVEQGTTGTPSQQVTLFEFDQMSRRVKEIVAPSAVVGPGSPDTRDLTTEHRYDAAGRLSCTILPDGTRTWYVYDAAGQQIQTINAMGEVSESVYDANGRVAQSRRYLNRLSEADLAKLGDAIGAPVVPQVSANDQRSYFVYDNDGRQRYMLRANIGTAWTIAENRFDPNGNIVETRSYDKFLPEARLDAIDTSASPGISVAETQAELVALGYSNDDGALAKTRRTRFAYDANNRLRFKVDALGSVSESVYDPAGQLVSSVRYATRPVLTAITENAIAAALNRADTSNQVSHYAYDAAGRLRYSVLVLSSDATGKPTRHLVSEQAYDALGRVVQTIAYATLLGPVADYKAATLAGAITAGAQDRRSAFVYDAAGRKVYSVQVLMAGSQNIVSKREFDALDRLVGSTSYAKTMALADFGRATLDSATTTNASAQDRTTSFVYDAAGRQRFVVGADGSLSEKVYDALGRIKESRQFDLLLSSTTPRTEDALSARRAGRAVGDGITRGEKYSYDRAGRLLTTTDAAAFTETNEYNAPGDRTGFTDKNGAKWRYVYDRQGRLFDQFSPPVAVQVSNETAPTNRSLQTRLYHDAFGSLVKRLEAAQTVDQRFTEYAYDRLGRQIVMVQPGWYDPATGRVEARWAAGRFQCGLATTYDALGNQVRTKLQTGINSYQYEYKTYDNLGRVVYDVDALSNVTAFAYNAFGEQTSVTRYGKSAGAPPQGVDTPWTASALADALGNDPLARTMTIRYDNLGRKTRTIQPTVASYFFSGSSGRFVPLDSSITPVSASGSAAFEYNPFGELFHQTVQLDSTRAQESWRYYDTMGRETRAIVKDSDNIAGEGGPPRPEGIHTARIYDAFGNLTQVIEYAAQGEADNSGNFLTAPLTPDESGADRISTYVYDARNRQTDMLRSNLSYAALENGQYVQVEIGRGNGVKVRHTDYDGLGRVSASTDAMNNFTRSTYNALGKLIQVTEPARLVVKSGLNNPDPFLADGRVLTSPVTDLVLNAFGQTVTSTRSPGRGDVAGATQVTRTGYDFGGNAVSTTDALGNVKNWRYDFSGRLVRETQEINSTLGARFDGATQQFQVWRVIGHTLERRYAYDAVGRMTDTLDVFMNGPTLAQSGQRKVYNAFGEVTQEQIVWGAASDALSNLQHATRLRNAYDSAGNLVIQDGADGQTRFFYNLKGQRTRAEQRGDNSTADGTHSRISETGYDLMGRTAWQSKPIFSSISGMVTPLISLILDRWGNVSRLTEVGDLGNGSSASIRNTFYEYNADNKVISAELGFAWALRADGTSYPAIVTHQTRYDLACRAVEQIDVAENTLTLSRSTLRTRRTIYDGIGQVVEQQDAEQLGQGLQGLRYAYDADGNRVATLNAVGNVFVDAFDASGNQLTHNVLRLSSGGEIDTYVSGSGNVPVTVLLNSHGYDQANRRIETRDYVSSSLFNASYTQYDERGFVRGTFQLQERAGSLPYSEDPGRETSCDYDTLGNKVRQTDASGHSMAWGYNTAADGGNQPNFTINRLTSTTSTTAGGGFNHTTAYTYTDFGQVRQETYTGTDITDSTAQNNRVYEYKENGLLVQMTDHQTVGTPDIVADPVVVGFGGWLDFKFLFAGRNSGGENRIYAVDQNGQLLSYGDAGTSGNVSDPVVVGFGGWSGFKYLFAGANSAGENRIYAVDQNGQLLSYGDAGTPGNVSDPVVVGFGGWLGFEFLFAGRNSGGENRIYAVDQNGRLLSYGDAGTPGNVSDPAAVGFSGWSGFKFLFAGANSAGENHLYAVDQNGQLLSYKDAGTPGLGGLDYWSSTSVNKYTYTDRGLVSTVDIDTTGFYEDFAQFGGVVIIKPAQAERRTIGTSYDERDRPVSVINSCFDIQGVSKHSSADVTYDYDELGNRTRITFSSVARSTMPDGNTQIGEVINGRQLWFDYDHEGRMTLANKTLDQDGTVTDDGVVITYDAAGRRGTTLTKEGTEIRGVTHPKTGKFKVTESWDQSRLERYIYNDLGYLTKIEQAGVRSNKLKVGNNTPIPDDPGPSPFMPSETRSYDFLGNLTDSSQHSHFRFTNAFDMTMEPQSLQVTVKNHYTAAGLLETQTSNHPGSPRANTNTKNFYNNHGILQSYTYTQGDGLGTDANQGFKNTYNYSYAFKAGALREGGIEVESNLKNSTTTQQRNTYDGRGNLVWQRSIDGPGNTEMVFFDYDGSGRVLDRAKIDLPPTRQVISGDRYNSFFYNSSGEAVGNVPTSSFAATRASLHANFGIGFTPVSSTYPSSQPNSYAVVAGDTLAGIAKSFLGDEQLWYLIADANGLTAGPTDPLQSQVGRSLRIPNVVTNVHNNAGTFSPYNPNTIIPNTPWIGAPLPPPGPSAWERSVQQLAPVVGMATSMVLGVTLSGLGPLGVGIAAAAGDLANQSFQIGLGRKTWHNDFKFGEVGEAGLTGAVASGLSAIGSEVAAAIGGGMAAQALAQGGAAAATYAVKSGIHEAFHRGEALGSFSGWSLLTATAGGAATPVLGGFFSQMYLEALNPKTGWVWNPNARAWNAFYQQLVIGLGQVAIQDSFGSPRVDAPKPEQKSRPMPAELLEEWDEIDRQLYKADLAAQAAAKAQQPDVISSADWAADQLETRLTLTVPSDHDIVQALRAKQIYVVQKGDRSTEDIAEHMGHDRRDGSYLALANGYDPRYVKEGDVFYNTYVSPNDARLANAQIYPIERQAKLARNERRLQQELAAGRQKAALEAAVRIAEEEELRGIIGEPPSLETLANFAMEMNNPAVQIALSNPDFGRKIPVTKTIFYQGMPFTVSGLHEIGSQPEIDADWSANSMVVDMVDIQTESEIANRTGQSDYLNFKRYIKRFPSSSLEGYLQYRKNADRETLGAWHRYANAAGAVNLIAGGTLVAVGSIFNPVATLLPLAMGKGTELVVSAAGYGELAPEFGNLVGTVGGLGVGAWLNPKVAVGSFIGERTAGMGLRALGVSHQDADIFAGLAGMATGGVIASRQSGSSVRALLNAQRAARYDLARPKVFEQLASKGDGRRGFLSREAYLQHAEERSTQLEDILDRDFPNLEFTHRPQYGNLDRTTLGMARRGVGTTIAERAFQDPGGLHNTIVHEELHHRWWSRGIEGVHHSDRFELIIDYYLSMRGLGPRLPTNRGHAPPFNAWAE